MWWRWVLWLCLPEDGCCLGSRCMALYAFPHATTGAKRKMFCALVGTFDACLVLRPCHPEGL